MGSPRPTGSDSVQRSDGGTGRFLSRQEATSTYAQIRSHKTPQPISNLTKYSSGRLVCGVDATTGRLWTFNSTGLYQVDSLTSTSWQTKTLPTNVVTTTTDPAVCVHTPLTGANAGTPLMFLLAYNGTTTRVELYSAPLVSGSTQPTWTGPLLTLAANATSIPYALRSTSVGLFVGEYTGTPNIAAGPSVYRATDGATFTTVLGPLADSTRHVHGIFEDPYSLGTIYVTLGDTTAPHMIYRSTTGGGSGSWTAITGTDANLNTWQAVSLGFTPSLIYGASDQSFGFGTWVMDRTSLTPRWANTGTRPDRIAVPGGTGGRVLTDVSTTSGSATITSAAGAFNSSTDKGRLVSGGLQYPDGAFISSVTNATTAVLSANALATGTNVVTTIQADTFYASGYVGAIDPATGWWYVATQDSSVAGTVAGIWVLPGLDAGWTLLYPLFNITPGNHAMYLAGGYLFYHYYGPIPLLTP